MKDSQVYLISKSRLPAAWWWHTLSGMLFGLDLLPW